MNKEIICGDSFFPVLKIMFQIVAVNFYFSPTSSVSKQVLNGVFGKVEIDNEAIS